MGSRRSLSIIRPLLCALCVVGLSAVPVSGQQAVGPGMLGSTPPCIAGSNPALFDHSFDGPTPDDLPAYLEPGEFPNQLIARYPTEQCNSEGSNEFWMYEETSGNPWPGAVNLANGLFDGWFQANVADQNGDFIGGTYEYFSDDTGQVVSHPLVLLESDETPGAYDRVQATGGNLNLVGGIQGWDLEPRDGVADYVGLSWENLVEFGSCPGAPDLDQTMMLWVPVTPIDDGPTGSVAIRFDLDCDGVPDGGYPPPPPIVPEATVPVGLQSFTVAALLPSGPRGIALAVLICAVPIGVLPLARRWLTGTRD
jgi:hypothetical protein